MRRPLKLRRLGAGLCASLAVVAFAATSATTTACQDRTCTGSFADFGRAPFQGELIDPDTWESTPQGSKWLPYPGQRSWFFFPRGLERRQIASVLVYISPVESPNDPGGQYTVASGNVATIRTFADPADPQLLNPGVQVGNDTCADFFVRVVVRAYPAGDAGLVDAAAPAQEAGDNDDGGSDAGIDAPNDGASE